MSNTIAGFDKVEGFKDVTTTSNDGTVALDVNLVGGGGSDPNLEIIKDSSTVNVAWDYYDITYVASGNGIGQVETITYYTGTAPAGVLVLTLTYTYNSDNNISRVVRVG